MPFEHILQDPAAAALVAAALLLPVLFLFRLIGCALFLDGNGTQVRLVAIVPDVGGQGDFTVFVSFETEPEGEEPSSSPADLELVGTPPDPADDRLLFEGRVLLQQDDYLATCVVERSGAATRTASCSGTLDAQDLLVAFVAEDGEPDDALRAAFCFEPDPEAQPQP